MLFNTGTHVSSLIEAVRGPWGLIVSTGGSTNQGLNFAAGHTDTTSTYAEQAARNIAQQLTYRTPTVGDMGFAIHGDVSAIVHRGTRALVVTLLGFARAIGAREQNTCTRRVCHGGLLLSPQAVVQRHRYCSLAIRMQSCPQPNELVLETPKEG